MCSPSCPHSSVLLCPQEKLSKDIDYLIGKESQVKSQISELNLLMKETEVSDRVARVLPWFSFFARGAPRVSYTLRRASCCPGHSGAGIVAQTVSWRVRWRAGRGQPAALGSQGEPSGTSMITLKLYSFKSFVHWREMLTGKERLGQLGIQEPGIILGLPREWQRPNSSPHLLYPRMSRTPELGASSGN